MKQSERLTKMSDAQNTPGFSDIIKKVQTPQEPSQTSSRELYKEIAWEDIEANFFSKNSQEYSKRPYRLNFAQRNFMDYFGEKLYDFYRELRTEYTPSGFLERVDHNGFMDIFMDNLFIYEKERYDIDAEDGRRNRREG